jgi:NADH-quinone oxidoreductase subunit J
MMTELIFYLLAGLMVISSMAVLLIPNPLYATLSLVANLLAVAGIYAILNAHFLAVVQVTVYAGAVMVLILFVIMLINNRDHEARIPSKFLFILAGSLALMFMFILFPRLSSEATSTAVEGSVKSIGLLLYQDYAINFQIAGILLLAAMVGAIMVGRRSGN